MFVYLSMTDVYRPLPHQHSSSNGQNSPRNRTRLRIGTRRSRSSKGQEAGVCGLYLEQRSQESRERSCSSNANLIRKSRWPVTAWCLCLCCCPHWESMVLSGAMLLPHTAFIGSRCSTIDKASRLLDSSKSSQVQNCVSFSELARLVLLMRY